MRVIVCGGRDFDDQRLMHVVLEEIHGEFPVTELIHGDAAGADRMAGRWGKYRQVRVVPVPADWRAFGKLAGRLRNMRMLEMKPDLVVAFPGGRGTGHMASIAREAGVRVIVIPPPSRASPES